MRQAPALSGRYRLAVATRVVAALVGGYGVAVMTAIALAWAVPLERVEAVMLATIVALLVWPFAAMSCFWAKSALRAWAGLAMMGAALAVLAIIGGWRP